MLASIRPVTVRAAEPLSLRTLCPQQSGHLSNRPCVPALQAGCKHCYDTPFASRPAARAKPKQGRYHNTLPAAPTFYPTAEEWEDPFAYLSKIHPEATKAGIALIVPPKGWEPPIQMLDQETGQLRTDLQVRTPSTASPMHSIALPAHRMHVRALLHAAAVTHPPAKGPWTELAARMDKSS